MHLNRSLLLQDAFEDEVEHLAGHLSGEHEQDLDFAGRPDQRGINDAETLGHERQPGAEVGDRVIGVLEASEEALRTGAILT